MEFHLDYRIPVLDKVVFVSKCGKEVSVGFGRTAIIFGRWFAYLER